MLFNIKKLFMAQPVYGEKSGFGILLTVIIIGSVILSLVFSYAAVGIASLRGSQTLSNFGKAKSLANTCSDYALNYIRSNNSFVGSNSLNLFGGSCQYTVGNLGGNIRQIDAVGNYGGVTRKIRITTNSFRPNLVVSSWQEVGD